MYEKMFNALEDGNSLETIAAINDKPIRAKKGDDMFNSTSMSFGKEIEYM